MDSTFGIFMTLAIGGGLVASTGVLGLAFLLNRGWGSDPLFSIADNPGKAALGALGISSAITLVTLLLGNVPYWLSKKPFGWHDLATQYVVVHDQFGVLLLGGSIGGAVIAGLLLVTLLKRQFVI